MQTAPDIESLTAAAANARRQYQACRYSELTKNLPDLLARLDAACLALDGEDQLRAYAMSADAHHVAAGLLLKLDDQGLAGLAAFGALLSPVKTPSPSGPVPGSSPTP